MLYCVLNPDVCVSNFISNNAADAVYDLVQSIEIIEIVAGVALDGFIVYSTSKKSKEEVQMAIDMKSKGWDQIFVIATFVPLVFNLAVLVYQLS